MPLQMPHVSVCDSHNSLPQSEHSLLAVLEQGNPSSSAEFLTSMTSQLFGGGLVYDLDRGRFQPGLKIKSSRGEYKAKVLD